jgi:hypothetical protein
MKRLLAVVVLVAGGSSVLAQAPTFAARIAELSEPGGYFDTDNLISNERSYLQVMPELRRTGRAGGVYIGVGPDQNFSYIAALRPSIAFIVDIRRDNLLLQLLFKALFDVSETRIDYLCALFDCAPPAPSSEWKDAPLATLLDYVAARPSASAVARVSERQIDAVIRTFGVPLAGEDFETIRRFRRAFVDGGLDLRFHSTGRAPQSYYPTYRQLLLERDPEGRMGNFLASEESYATVRALQRRDLVIPVVGDLGGPSALAAIARVMADRGETLSALYVSNVENYLFQRGAFGRFVENVGRLPRSPGSVIIRSVFGGFAASGRGSASALQPANELVEGYAAGRFRYYSDLVQ